MKGNVVKSKYLWKCKFQVNTTGEGNCEYLRNSTQLYQWQLNPIGEAATSQSSVTWDPRVPHGMLLIPGN